MKLFLLEGSKGEYDDYVSWTEGVFSTMELLEEYKQKYLENNEKIKNLPCPIDEEVYNQPQWYHIVSDEDWELVNDWEIETNKAKDFRRFNIIEYELDQEFKEEL